MPRGGPRPGAGRPRGSRTTEGWRKLSLALRPSLADRLDRHLERREESRSAWIAGAIRERLRRER